MTFDYTDISVIKKNTYFFIDSTSLLISLGSPKPLITTLAPLLARAFATDSPIPDVEPVTMADLPARKPVKNHP